MRFETPSRSQRLLLPRDGESEVAPIAALCTDMGLRTALLWLRDRPDDPDGRIWDEIGAEVLERAERDARGWGGHAAEFAGAYAVAVIEALKLRADKVLHSRSPWGLLSRIGQQAGLRAVGELTTGGLIARDETTHRVRLSDVPRVVSLDSLTLSGDLPAAG